MNKQKLQPNIFLINAFILTLLGVSTMLLAERSAQASSHADKVIVSIPSGGGTVVSNPAGINCPGDCEEEFQFGTTVTLTPTPAAGRTYLSWTGICSSSLPACTFYPGAPAADITHKVSFGWSQHTLQVTKKGAGTGTVTSSPGGINCGASCIGGYNNGTTLTLTAMPAAGSVFAGWGAYAEGGRACLVETGKANSSTTRVTAPTCQIEIFDTTTQLFGTAVAYFEPKASSSSITKPAAASPTAAPVPNKPSVPSAVTINGQAVTEVAELKYGESIEISGKTLAKGVVDLYIFSDPQHVQVTADDTGQWRYIITNLEPGEHRVEAEVTDPASGQKSERSRLASFKVTGSKVAAGGVTTNANKRAPVWLVSVALGLTVAIAAGWWWRRRSLANKSRPV